MHINTGESKPVWIRQYPIPPAYLERAKARFELWKERGWIAPAPVNCAWNSPLLVAPKTDKDALHLPASEQDIRMCGDYRELNKLIVDEYDNALPGIREILNSLGPFEWVTMIDLEDSYNQMQIAVNDQYKTAFTFMGEQWMFTVVPYGLKMAPGFMQRLMERLLSPLGVTPLLDDCPIADTSKERHVQHVLQVLNALTYDAGLRIRMKKCKFFKSETRILGYLASRAGIQMDPAKVKAILNCLHLLIAKQCNDSLVLQIFIASFLRNMLILLLH